MMVPGGEDDGRPPGSTGQLLLPDGVAAGAAGAGAGEAAGAAAAAGAGTEVPAAAAESDEASEPDGLALAPLSRKSVTYQPLPFSWKAGAVSCLEKVSCWHSGHTTSGASVRFCRTSFPNPQCEHRYAKIGMVVQA